MFRYLLAFGKNNLIFNYKWSGNGLLCESKFNLVIFAIKKLCACMFVCLCKDIIPTYRLVVSPYKLTYMLANLSFFLESPKWMVSYFYSNLFVLCNVWTILFFFQTSFPLQFGWRLFLFFSPSTSFFVQMIFFWHT